MADHHESFKELSLRYLRMLAIVSCATIVRLVVDPTFDNSGFSIFLVAILVNAWLGGVGPSLLGQTLLLMVNALVSRSTNQNAPSAVPALVGLAAYYLVGTLTAILSEARRTALQRVALQNEKISNQQQELSATISGIGDAVLVTDNAGCVRFMNPVAEAMTGWELDQASGKNLEKILPVCDEGQSPWTPSSFEAVYRQGIDLREGRILWLSNRNGSQIPITYTATPIRDSSGGVSGVVVIVRNETARQQAEDELRNINQRKDDFLATLAHELRNPLAPIRTGLQLLKLSGVDQSTASEVQEILERQTQHMVRLVDDLLDVSRISRGKLQLRKSSINVARVVGSAVETMRPLIDQARHRLILRIPEGLDQIEADPDRLTQITCNLLHNAIKFTPPGGLIEINVEQNEQELELAVTDNGCGIAPEHLQSIFEMFNQGAIEKEKGQSGLGIGLALSRQLAELHGGTIDAHSQGSRLGSTFRLRLPRSNRFSFFETSTADDALKPISNRRVLVVDDHEDGLRTITLMLQSLGCQTCMARDGFVALDAAKSFRPDVVLMDLGMPRLNGFQAAERLRKEPWGQDVLLIAITGWGQDRDRQRTQAAGFDDHFVKPVDLELLRSCLERKRVTPGVTENLSTIPAAMPERN